jgi:hypothetical protein
MITRFLAPVAVLLLAVGCVTAEPEGPETAERTHYTLKEGKKVKNPKPLPDQTDIEVVWHYSNGATTTVDGFRGWDLDGDERYDMVEVLNEDGTTQSYVYDFDGDGRVDLVKDKAPSSK